MKISNITALVFLTLLIFTAVCRAEVNPQHVESVTHEISGEVMSPFCPGRSLNDCPSSSATELRNNISAMLSEGKNKDQVLDELYKKYGDEIRAMPKATGFGLVGWLTPLAFLLLGAVILVSWISKHRPASEEVSSKNELSPDMLKRIEEEVSGKH